MGVLNFLFGKREEKHVDGFWGEMIYIEGSSLRTGGFFRCKKYFTPLARPIDVYLAAGKDGLVSQQTEFYKEIEQRYADVVKAVIPVLEDEFGNWQEGFKIKNFEQEFSLLSIHLPECINKPVDWEIPFSTIHDDDHMFTVIFRDFIADGVQIDG